jgi:hypothetical protein
MKRIQVFIVVILALATLACSAETFLAQWFAGSIQAYSSFHGRCADSAACFCRTQLTTEEALLENLYRA